jgi:rubrerythrin
MLIKDPTKRINLKEAENFISLHLEMEKNGNSNMNKFSSEFKVCPDCTFHCDEEVNFCPICNHKFQNQALFAKMKKCLY